MRSKALPALDLIYSGPIPEPRPDPCLNRCPFIYCYAVAALTVPVERLITGTWNGASMLPRKNIRMLGLTEIYY